MNKNKITLEQLNLKAKYLSKLTLRKLFEQGEDRNKYVIGFDEFHLDFSKQFIDDDVFAGLQKLAKECDLTFKIKQLLEGSVVNKTENRPALHTALRLPESSRMFVGDSNITSYVHEELRKVEKIVSKVQKGQWRGFSGKPITNIVNIGVGGSDLGPFMVVNALKEYRVNFKNKLEFHFVSSMDGTQLSKILNSINQEESLFIVSSKSFTTIDTFYNANTALEWMLKACTNKELILNQHFIGVSANKVKMAEWGISTANQLMIWDWVGGRFSLWSAIGLTIALSIGYSGFKELLAGAHSMDLHFLNEKHNCNLPIILGLLGVWNTTFMGINAHTVLPYDGRLQFFPNYLTQLEMESNGKSIDNNGNKVSYQTCPVLWGDIGPNAQHAFYQLLHQGTQRVSCDFIAPIKRYGEDKQLKSQHELALANCLAQSRVLAFGNNAISSKSDVPSHKYYNGNQPSSTILIDELTPYTLGGLIALYEHKVFVMAAIWDINPFDQWGVELGKIIANELLDVIKVTDPLMNSFDSSTNSLLKFIKDKN